MEKIQVTCEMEVTLKMIGGKCKPLILENLIEKGTQRFSELMRAITQVSQRTLTNQLRELENDCLITRTVYAEVPPRVEYSITQKGRSLEQILELMCEWGEKNMEVPVKFLRCSIVHIIALRRVVDAGDAVQKTRLEFFQQNIGNNLLFRLPVVADASGSSHYKAGLAIEIDIALDAQSPSTKFSGPFHGVVQQIFSKALPLEVRADADGAEGHHRNLPAIIGHDFGPHIQYMPNELAVPLHDQIQLRHKVRILTQHMDHIVLQAAGAVHIPKSLPGQILYGSVVCQCFPADDDIVLSHSSSSI